MTLKRRITVITTALLVMVAAAAFIIPGIASSDSIISRTYGDLTVSFEQDKEAEVLSGLSYENNVLTITTAVPVILSGTSVSDRVVVSDEADITLSGLNIDVSAVDGACALAISDDLIDDVAITLADGTENILASGVGCAGLQKNVTGASACGKLMINGDELNTGVLKATGGTAGAGIGGGGGKDTAGIVINGGVITADGTCGAAGIGGGSVGKCATVEINGGSIIANGSTSSDFAGADGADIGYGFAYDQATMTASDGAEADLVNRNGRAVVLYPIATNGETVTINGVPYASEHDGVQSINPYIAQEFNDIWVGNTNISGLYDPINGSTESVHFKVDGEDIVYGTDYTYKLYAVDDGNGGSKLNGVLHILSEKPMTINGIDLQGYSTDRDRIFIEPVGANVTLTGLTVSTLSSVEITEGDYTYGCAPVTVGFVKNGASYTDNVTTITFVDGSENILKSGDGFSGIEKGEATALVITCESYGTEGHVCAYGTCGKLVVTGGENGAGIGGTSGSDITINGGCVIANGGENGAAIGGGNGVDGEDIIINNAIVTARGGEGGAAIGGGKDGTGADILINGGSVYTEVTALNGNAPAKIGDGATDSADGAEEIPLNSNGDAVYLYTIEKDTDTAPAISGIEEDACYPAQHGVDSDTNVYAYLTGTLHNIEVGSSLDTIVYDTESGNWAELGTDLALSCDEELVYGDDFEYPKGGTLTINSTKAITISMGGVASTSDVIAIKDGIDANITLNGVNITASDAAALSVADGSTGDVTITLVGDNTLTGGDDHAGIEKNGTGNVGTLTITGSGSLTANGGAGAAGIGGGKGKATDSIEISGGTVTASGGSFAAGIGGGNGNGNAEDIIISGGEVVANGMDNAAGIGGGNGGVASNITISGGSVTAEGGERGVAIGAGAGKACGDIIITGGSVKVADKTFTYDGDDYFVPAFGSGVLSQENQYIDGDAVEPTNGSSDVYLIVVDNSRGKNAIYVNGEDLELTRHSASDSNLYIYRAEELVTVQFGSVDASSDADTDKYRLYTDGYLPVPEASQFAFTYQPDDPEYNGESKEATVTANDAEIGDVTVNYYDEDGNQLGSAPVDAGTYTVKISVAESDAYAEAEDLTDASWNFTIKKQKIAFPTYTVAEKTYDGTVGATVSDLAFTDANGNPLFTSADYTVTGEFVNADAGTKKKVTVTVTLNETDNTKNYALAKNTDTYTQGVIKPVEIMVSDAVLADKTYDGTTNVTVESVEFKTLDGKVIGVTGYTAVAEYIDASAGGNQRAKVTVTAINSTNYVLSEENNYCYAFGNVENAELKIVAIDIEEKIYDGTNKAVLTGIIFKFNGNEMTLTEGVDYTAEAVFTDYNAGKGKTVNVTVDLKDTAVAGNFTVNGPVEFRGFEISKATHEPVENTDVSFAWGAVGEHSVTIPTLRDDLGEVYNVSANITDDDDIISDDVSVESGGAVVFTLNENTVDNIGDVATVEVVITTQNYENITALVNIEIADKEQSPDPECNITFMLANDGTFTAVIEKYDGAEYKFGDGEWSTENTALGFGFNTPVTGYIRIVETDTHYASNVVSATATTPKDVVMTPAIVPGNVTHYYDSLTVIITCATEGASIYYTTDGSEPTVNSTLYAGEFTITSGMTVNAIAVRDGMKNSEIATATFTREYYTVKTPVIVPAGDNVFYNSQKVIITCATKGATIYYTTDGTEPTVNSTKYVGEFTITSDTTVNAIAVYDGMFDSEVATATFTKDYYTVKTPVIIPAGETVFFDSQTVIITCATPGATIYYTTDGSKPTANSTPYVGEFTVTANTTVNAIAIYEGMRDSAIATAKFTRDYYTVDTPVISPAGTTYYGELLISITCATPGSTIYYTTDGADPTDEHSSRKVYEGPFEINKSMTVKAYAVAENMYDSAVASEVYERDHHTVKTPVIFPATTTYYNSQTVVITCATKEATIHYTTDGSVPTAKSPVYTGPFEITATTIVKAVAIADDMYDSAVVTETLTREFYTVETPVITPTDGSDYVISQTVTISCATEGATIYYTTDGTTPTVKSEKYTKPFTITATTTVKAYAVAKEMYDSTVASAVITRKIVPAATPVITPADGTIFAGAQTVTITCATQDSTIYYTTNGAEPTVKSRKYTGPFTITGTATIKAFAVCKNMDDSAVATAKLTKQVITTAKTVAAPTFMPGSGSEFSGTEYVTINCATEGATIYYTTDGSTPTPASTKYTGNITVTKTTTIKAIAICEGMNDSAVSTARYVKYSSGGTGGSSGGTGGSSGGGGSTGGTSGGTTGTKVPSIYGSNMSWTQIVDAIKANYKGRSVTIELNGNQTVPEYVIAALAEAECVVTFEVDGTTAWTIDGNDVTTATKANLQITDVVRNDTQKLEGEVGRQFKINNVNAPAKLSINFKKSNQFKYADLYKWNGTKYEYVCSAKLTKDGTATLPYVGATGYYTVMINNNLHGDVNGDGAVDVLDASAILMKIAGIAIPKNPEEVDYNVDGKDTVADATAILQMLINSERSEM